jgi:hypothetical protein
MSRWLLLLMIALLPLRGWVGEAMAAEMSAQQVQANRAAAVVSQVQAPLHHAAHDDCIEHASDPRAGPAAAESSDCPACAMCQACSAMALVSFVEKCGAAAPRQQRPTSVEARFASADEARGFKPPIS